MKRILLFGAGKSATVLIDYLVKNADKENWQLTVVDADLQLAQGKIGESTKATAISFDINDAIEREKQINQADIVISLLPPALHYIVAQDCVKFSKNLLNASYLDDKIRSLQSEIENKNLLFICELGLDPGIDHMSAKKMIDGIHEQDGEIISFMSHCGGLVAPENDDNPWHYKISWNPGSVVLAGKSGAHYKEKGEEVTLSYEEVFNTDRWVEIPGLGAFNWYPNRDSLSYSKLYKLESAETFVRTTLRHRDFMYGWKNVIDLKLTDETKQYQTDGKTMYQIFKLHMDLNGFSEWLEKKLKERFTQTKSMLDSLVKLAEAENEAKAGDAEIPQEFMAVDPSGGLHEMELDDVKNQAASYLAHKMHEANLTLKQLFYLGLDDKKTFINKGLCSPADVLQFALEQKLPLKTGEKDMIVMLHEIQFRVGSSESGVRSLLIVEGEDDVHTAMAKTVGLPLGIAAKLILNGAIQLKGLHIPVRKEIYEPVLKELEEHGIRFDEQSLSLS
jgi:saccharopine dehydrogenase-like NADP-dependent oxidoreductase